MNKFESMHSIHVWPLYTGVSNYICLSALSLPISFSTSASYAPLLNSLSHYLFTPITFFLAHFLLCLTLPLFLFFRPFIILFSSHFLYLCYSSSTCSSFLLLLFLTVPHFHLHSITFSFSLPLLLFNLFIFISLL